MSKYFNGDMTVGNPVKLILLFTIPILIGNVFQQLYNVVDTAVIGHVLGDNSLAAVGSTSPVYMLIVGFATGVTNGFSVVLARFYGKKDMREMEKTVSYGSSHMCALGCAHSGKHARNEAASKIFKHAGKHYGRGKPVPRYYTCFLCGNYAL